MTYELAKQLKDAGFPQAHNYDENGRSDYVDKDYKGDALVGYISIPTLSELITACGDKFFTLERLYDGCFAANDDNGNRIGEEYETPEEAIAKLWLALNAK